VVKPAAFDRDTLNRHPLPADFLTATPHGEHILNPGIGWMADVAPKSRLIFALYRGERATCFYCLVLSCDTLNDSLRLLPLENKETPLSILADPERRDTLQHRVHAHTSTMDRESTTIEVSLSRAIDENRLGCPIPPPGRIYAVAANFPSHLEHDLAISLEEGDWDRLRAARPRVFLKHPPITPAGANVSGTTTPLGPYDGIHYPQEIILPSEDGSPSAISTPLRLDYEVEVGAVIGRSLTWQDVQNADDRAIHAAVAGFVLISDAKARNPQVVDKVADEDLSLPPRSDPYGFADPRLDRAFGFWDQTTCRWWSYAASMVDATSIGPFFVAAIEEDETGDRAVISARSYADEHERDAPVPGARKPNRLYLRQCARMTERSNYVDRLIWNLPQIVRSILTPDVNALRFGDFVPRLEAGDVICLGTPGGVVITSMPQGQFSLLEALLFWMKPSDWHDAFFRRTRGYYLRQGDQVFYWAEGLGYQLQRIYHVAPQQ